MFFTRCNKLLISLLFLAPPVFAQGVSISGQAIVNTPVSQVPGITSVLQAVPNAVITVCAATGGGLPCSPLVSIYKDSALTVPVANPLALCVGPVNGCIDANGNFQFWIPPNSIGYIYSQTSPSIVGGIFIISGLSSGGGGSGTVISVSTTGPLTGGPITTTGTISCPTCTITVASGTAVLGTSLIGSGACAAAVTVAATGVATTDNISADFNADPTGVVGYQASASGMLTIIKYPTLNNVNFKVCNNTAGSITPGAITLNWRVPR
jgi:hypothetical protein